MFLLLFKIIAMSTEIQNAYVIETKDLTKVYGKKTVLDAVSMHVAQGDIYGFIGKNGAGKTTLMKLLLGMSHPNHGSLQLFGSDDLNAGRRRIGALIEAPAFYANCTAYENLQRFAILANAEHQDLQALLQFVGLGDVGKKKTGKFSLGMKQRLGIAIAMLGDPELLILDEPINGLDPEGIKEIRDLLLRLNREKGVTILVSSHLLDELAKITTRYGIINNGRLVEETTADALTQRCQHKLNIVTEQPLQAVKLIQKLYPQWEVTYSGNRIQIVIKDQEDLNSAAINRELVMHEIDVQELTYTTENMEDYFIERMGGKA